MPDATQEKRNFPIEVGIANLAEEREVLNLAGLLNRAFAVENFFLVYNYVSAQQVRRAGESGDFLVLREDSRLVGSVYCAIQESCGLLGMLAVEPSRQRLGYGHRLISAAEDYLQKKNCNCVELRVVNLRTELLPFYSKQGYKQVKIEEFPKDIPVTKDCHLIRLAKKI